LAVDLGIVLCQNYKLCVLSVNGMLARESEKG